MKVASERPAAARTTAVARIWPAGRRHQPGRLHHRRPEDVPLLEGHVAQSDPDPDGERSHAVASLTVDALLHRHGAGDSTRGGAEHRQDPVTERLDLLAPTPGQCLAEDREVASAQLIESVLPQPGKQIRRPHQVGEQDRCRPARHSPRPHTPIVSFGPPASGQCQSPAVGRRGGMPCRFLGGYDGHLSSGPSSSPNPRGRRATQALP